MRIRSFFKKKIIDPLAGLLRQGVSPRMLAWSLSIGMAVGFSPLIGLTTLLCTGIAFALKLNPVAINLANWLVYPLQILLFLPFLRFGSNIFGIEFPDLELSQIMAWFQESPWRGIQTLGVSYLAGSLVWLLASVPFVLVTQQIIFLIINKAKRPSQPVK
ncbi:membrane protein [Fulvitalea axinellae]|uniref:Membrane protein n=1 Tax=Fulvitalea axinellae TaxID=1182444 RepID=A0AAU9CD35_9BACT|nr:membrane protein [Fulvitalea axinellae]